MFSGYNAVLLSLLEMSLSFSELYLVILFENNSTKKIEASVWAKLNGVVSVLGEDTTCHVLQVRLIVKLLTAYPLMIFI
jgi:hypothetical protein